MKSAIERFHSLDLLRGVAALSVVFWHWQHFFYSGTGRNYPLERMPLVDVFFLLYAKGWLAVELFFSLS
jgi:peptidoglycan/LPS O-acetylase OafA/YrhL